MTNLFGEEEIRALSWKQPYADLMLHGKIETRTWHTKYRGLVLICSSVQAYGFSDLMNISGEEQIEKMQKTLSPAKTGNLYIDNFIYSDRMKYNFYNDCFQEYYDKGFAIAVGKLVDCRLMKKSDEDKCFVKYREPWKVGRYNKKTRIHKVVEKKLWCHIYEDVKQISPFPWKGSQGWKTLNQEEKNKIVYI